jgi:hypothetical protein
MPPTRGRRQSRNNRSDPDLLWINRTPDSRRLTATRQERDEVRAITNHARQWRTALRRQQRLSSAQTEATHAQSVVGWEQHSALSDSSSSDVSAAPSPLATGADSGETTNASPSVVTLEEAWWSGSAYTFAVETWLPTVFQDLDLVDSIFPSLEVIATTIQRIIQICANDQIHLYCLVAASSAFSKYVLGRQQDRPDGPEYSMAKALQSVREYLAGEPEPSDALIFDLLALSAFERYVGNLQGGRIHMQMVAHLLQSRGEHDQPTLPLRMLCCLFDLYAAGGMGEAPLLSAHWDPGPIPDNHMSGVVLATLAQDNIAPGGTALLQPAQALPREMAVVLEDAIKWFQVQQYNQHIHHADTSTCHWTPKRALALVHRLLSFHVPQPMEENARWLNHLASAIKQGLLLAIADFQVSRWKRRQTNITRDTTPLQWASVQRLRREISALLELEHNQLTVEYEGVLLWTACLGLQAAVRLSPSSTTASANQGGEHDDREYFISIARRFAVRRKARASYDMEVDGSIDAEDVTELLNGYLYCMAPDGRPTLEGLEELIG